MAGRRRHVDDGCKRDISFTQLNWGLIAASSERRAEIFAHQQGINATLLLRRTDLLMGPRSIRHAVRQAGLEAVAVHSADWKRQRSPQVYELALAVIPARERLIIDEATGSLRRTSRAALIARATSLPAQTAQAGGHILVEAGRYARGRRRPRPSLVPRPAASVLAIWPGSGANVGGAVSHIAGVLNAFRRAGLRVGLVTGAPPPEQVLGAIDDLEICPPLPPHARITGDASEIISNGAIRTAADALATRLGPAFIYQRHCGFLFAGLELSRRLNVPLVLEWNGSEVWVRENYSGKLAPERLLDRLAVAIERSVLAGAELIAAISEHAMDMAVAAGAPPSRTIVVPNGVDVRYVDASSSGHASSSLGGSRALIGWAGSFGPTRFGGEVIVRAMARLPETVRLLMIGEGRERHSCQQLAADLGVSERIEWTGALPHRDTLRRLATCDILVAPYLPVPGQLFFNSPIKLFEYMALGRPIVASRLGQISEVLTDHSTARLVEPGDVHDLSAAILDVLQSPDRGRALGDAARREVEASHTWDHRVRAVLRRMPISTNANVEA